VAVLGVIVVVIVIGLVALWLRDRRRRLSDDAPMSIRDYDQDRRAYRSSLDMPPVGSDADRFGGGGAL
jgi:hypothetical protein